MSVRKNVYCNYTAHENDRKKLRKAAKEYLKVRKEHYDSRLDSFNYSLFDEKRYACTISFFSPAYWDRGYWYNTFVSDASGVYNRVEFKIPWVAVENFDKWKKTFLARRERQIERRNKWEEQCSKNIKTSVSKNTDEYETYLRLKEKYEKVA